MVDGSDTWDVERLQVALKAARLGDWTWDATTDVVTFSPRAAEIFGVAPGPHVTWTGLMRDVLHPDDRERARLAVETALAKHADYSLEYRVMIGDRERWVVASGRGRYGADGEALGMFGVVQDITSDRMLLRIDDALRALVSPADITYTAARELGQYLAVNRCAYAFVEDDQDTFDLTGNYTHGVQSIIGRYRFRQFSAECLRLMRANEPWVIEDSEADPRIDASDREAYRFTAIRAVICVPIHKSGRFVAAMAVHMNTPRAWTTGEVDLLQQVASRCWESIERARVESERRGLLEAAESANRAKDEFLAMLGHELRNPLAPIATALALMRQPEAPFERERTVIERQVTHLTRLVDDLLDVSGIARGKVTLKRERVELAEVVSRAVEIASPLLEERMHALVLDVPRGGLPVDGDVARLVQIVTNLLTNACKYTPQGGRIAITADLENDFIVLRVIDNGNGISAEILPHVFDLFMQGAQSIERAHGGLGLGLAIVRSLVEAHGGRVAAHSNGRSQGTELVVHLPHATGDSPAPHSNTPKHGILRVTGDKPTRVLVVDDNADAAEMLASALALFGCHVEVAHDGPEALAIADAAEFDVALLDIGLPVMDGYELAARLQQHAHVSRARLIALTGYGQESDRQRALDAGFHEHLVKPVALAKLEAIVLAAQRI